jgi:hypothetical protein
MAIVMTGDTMSVLIKTLGDSFCGLMNFSAFFLTSMSNWTIVIMTFTRFVAVVYPFRVALWCTAKAAKTYIFGILFAFTMWALPAGLFTKAPRSTALTAFQCVFQMPVELATAYEVGHSALAQVLPFILIVIFNSCISLSMRQRTEEVKSMTSHTTENRDEAMVKTMVIAVTVVYLILVLPYVFQVTVWQVLIMLKNLEGFQMQQRYFSYSVTTTLYAVNCAVNFYLYCICCKKFRQDFKNIIFRPLLGLQMALGFDPSD